MFYAHLRMLVQRRITSIGRRMRLARLRATRADIIAAVIFFGCATAAPADAEWAFAGYLGGSHTMSNTLRLQQPPIGTDVTFTPVDYYEESFTSPVYYGFRLTYYLPQVRWLGVESEFTHVKVFARTDQVARISGQHQGAAIDRDAPMRDIMQAFSITHGFNMIVANVVVRRTLATPSGSDDRIALLGRVGFGPTFLHPHSQIDDAARSGPYEIDAPVLNVSGGLEVRLWRGVGAFADYKLTRAAPDVTVTHGEVHGRFVSHHGVFGLVWHP